MRPINCLPLFVLTVLFGSTSLAQAEEAEQKVCVQVLLKDAAEAEHRNGPTTPASQAGSSPAAEGTPAAAAPVAPGSPTTSPSASPVASTLGSRATALPLQAAVRNQQPARPVEITPFLPLGQNPIHYLKRLFEHYVTHERGFVSVQEGCSQQITVELYPLAEGWTAFARYSGSGREEKVDQLFPSELSQFAERAVLALLHNQPIAGTINRENVLRADSLKSVQQIRGTTHWVLSLGTQIRGGQLPTAQSDGGALEELRILSPMTLGFGYRGKFESWGVEAGASLALGTSKTATRRNAEGGHIDLGGATNFSLHVLRYLQPRGLSTWYYGAGSTYEFLWFSAIEPTTEIWQQEDDRRSHLYTGGLDVDLVIGYEFMRASTIHFLMQGELHLPAYVIQSENQHGSLETWFPGASVKLGMVF